MSDIGVNTGEAGLVAFEVPETNKTYSASAGIFGALGRQIESTEEAFEAEGGSITADDAAYDKLKLLREEFRAANLKANSTLNPDNVNVGARIAFSTLEEKTALIIRHLDSGGTVDLSALHPLTAVQHSMDLALQANGYAVTDNDAFMPGGTAPGQGARNSPIYGEQSGSTTDGVVAKVQSILDDAIAADTPSEKIALFKEAVGLFSSGSSGTAETGGTTATGGGVSNVSTAPLTPAEPVMIEVEHVYNRDTLMGTLAAEGDVALTTGRNGDGGGNAGIGYTDSGEIDNTRDVTFNDYKTFSSASVSIADNHADSDGIQETVKIVAMKDGEEVWSREVRGDEDGIQTVEIDAEFDEIVFSTDDQTGKSDFSVVEIVGVTMEESETAGASNGAAVQTGTEAAEFVEALQIVIEQMEQMIANTSVQSMLSNSVVEIAKQATATGTSDSDGGAGLTKNETLELLNSVMTLAEDVEAKVPNDAAANEIINSIFVAASGLADLADD